MIDFVKYLFDCVLSLFMTPEGRIRAGIEPSDSMVGIGVLLFVSTIFILIKRIIGKIKKNKINQKNEQTEDILQEEILHPEYIDEETLQSKYSSIDNARENNQNLNE